MSNELCTCWAMVNIAKCAALASDVEESVPLQYGSLYDRLMLADQNRRQGGVLKGIFGGAAKLTFRAGDGRAGGHFALEPYICYRICQHMNHRHEYVLGNCSGSFDVTRAMKWQPAIGQQGRLGAWFLTPCAVPAVPAQVPSRASCRSTSCRPPWWPSSRAPMPWAPGGCCWPSGWRAPPGPGPRCPTPCWRPSSPSAGTP